MPKSLSNAPAPSAAANQIAASYTLVVAHDSYLIRAGIEGTLADEEQVAVAQYCHDLRSLLGAVEEHRPEVVITGIRLPPSRGDEGIQAAVTLRKTHPDVGVVVLSEYLEQRYALALFEQGTEGRAYLHLEQLTRSRLIGAIREVAVGGSMIDPKVVDVLVEARMRRMNSPLRKLTKREHEVLAWVAAGSSNAAIADTLFLTKRAVEKNINSIFSKLNLESDSVISRRVTSARLYLSDPARSQPDPSPA
jgi:DNA-binding NarL/FixJ family response regulator